jgi:hypothetical protein
LRIDCKSLHEILAGVWQTQPGLIGVQVHCAATTEAITHRSASVNKAIMRNQ